MLFESFLLLAPRFQAEGYFDHENLTQMRIFHVQFSSNWFSDNS